MTGLRSSAFSGTEAWDALPDWPAFHQGQERLYNKRSSAEIALEICWRGLKKESQLVGGQRLSRQPVTVFPRFLRVSSLRVSPFKGQQRRLKPKHALPLKHLQQK